VTGYPWVERTPHGEVLVVPLRVNVNLKAITVEEKEAQRQFLHFAMTKNLREELALGLAKERETQFKGGAGQASGELGFPAGESRDSSGSESDGLRRFLDSLQEKLIGEFDALADKQRRIPPDEFNDDDKYKQHLNEALDAKNKLLNKHRAILAMRMAGAGEHHLASCLRAPYTDFRGHELNEDPKVDLSWDRIFSEAKLAEKLISSFPFRLAPCQLALIWEKVLEGGSQVREVRIGAVTLPVSQIPNLSLSKCRLTDTVYERALAGLIQGASRPWSLDLRGNNFQDKDALVNAIVVGTSLVSLNKLSLTEDRTSLQRDRATGCVALLSRRKKLSHLELELDELEWAFVLTKAKAVNWQGLEVG